MRHGREAGERAAEPVGFLAEDRFDEATMLDDGSGSDRAPAAVPCTAQEPVGTDERGTVPAGGSKRC